MSKQRHSRLWLYFTLIVFATIAVLFALATIIWFALYELNVIDVSPIDRHLPIFIGLLISLMLGCVIALFVGKLIIRPIQSIGRAFDELASGNFDVRVSENERVREIREIVKKFNAMVHDLSHIETLRSDFVANVSHEFKTPLSSIEGYATLLQDPVISPEKHDRYVSGILDNSRKLSDLASNILMLSKLENQEIVAGRSEFRLDELLRRTILSLEDKWSPRNLEFDMDLPRVMYRGNEALLERVFCNIIDNAIKHSPTGGAIRISIDSVADGLSIAVGDSGDGMSEEVMRHIFEKFYQGDPSRGEEGNGLGLALVKRILDLCGGSIRVASAPGEGAEFTVLLPL